VIDQVKVLCPTRHEKGHFVHVLPSQSLGTVLKKLTVTQQKQTTQKQNSLNQKKTQNAKPKRMHKN